VVRRQAEGDRFLMKKNNITVVQGHGRLKGRGWSSRARTRRAAGLATKNVVLATGSVPEACSRG